MRGLPLGRREPSPASRACLWTNWSTMARHRGDREWGARDSSTKTMCWDARACLLGEGFDAASLADLQRATGLTKSSLYKAFESKEGLFRRVLDRYNRDYPLPRGRPGPTDATADRANAARRDRRSSCGQEHPVGLSRHVERACRGTDARPPARCAVRKPAMPSNGPCAPADAVRSAGALPAGMGSAAAAAFVCTFTQGLPCRQRGRHKTPVAPVGGGGIEEAGPDKARRPTIQVVFYRGTGSGMTSANEPVPGFHKAWTHDIGPAARTGAIRRARCGPRPGTGGSPYLHHYPVEAVSLASAVAIRRAGLRGPAPIGQRLGDEPGRGMEMPSPFRIR